MLGLGALALCGADDSQLLAAESPAGAMHQWSPAKWPTGTPMSLFDLIEQGYDVRAYQPGLERSWLYLQKGRKLFRCDTPERDPAPPACEELVKPY